MTNVVKDVASTRSTPAAIWNQRVEEKCTTGALSVAMGVLPISARMPCHRSRSGCTSLGSDASIWLNGSSGLFEGLLIVRLRRQAHALA